MIFGADGSPLPEKQKAKGFKLGLKQIELDAAGKRAQALLDNVQNGPDLARDEVIQELYVMCEALKKRILSPPRGKDGATFLTKAIPIFRDTKAALVGALDKRRKMREEILEKLGGQETPLLTEGVVDAETTEPGPRERPGRGGAKPAGAAAGGRGPKKGARQRVVAGAVGVPDGEGPGRPAGGVDEGRG